MATHDYSIANASGGAFRSDLNNALSAIASNNSNATDPSTTFAFQWYVDTGDSTLKIRNAANNAYVNVSAVGGVGTANLGLATTASPTFTGDVTISSTTALRVPVGTTAQRSGSAANGDIRYNSTSSSFEVYAGGAWGNIGSGSSAVIAEQQSAGTQAGTFTSGAWRTRSLNTEVFDPDSIVSLSSNAFTLQAGTYIIEWMAMAFEVNRHKTKLRDTTNSADIGIGTSKFAQAGTNNSPNDSTGAARVTITSATTYELQHQAETTASGNGFGIEAGFSTVETYALVRIFKEP